MTTALEAFAESPFLMSGRLTRDEDIASGKQYYTRTGSGTVEDPYILTPVASPILSEISTYFELIGPEVLLKLTNVPADQASKLDIAADSTDDHTEGTVRYTFPNTENKVDVYYILQ